MSKFGQASAAKLTLAHPDLQKIFNLAISRSPVDFAIVDTERSIEQQRDYFKSGKSKLNPDNPEHLKKAKHLQRPAMAVDIVIWIPAKVGLAYDHNHLCLVAGVITSCARELRSTGQITHDMVWGGNWDGDGEIITDQTFNDLPHFELI